MRAPREGAGARGRARDSPPLPLTHILRPARLAPAPLQDWHPADHASFASNNEGAALFSMVELEGIGPQIMWPNHCVQASPRARSRARTHTHARTRDRARGPPACSCLPE